jgi:aromatic-L-amino-acid/L-tryptophan decarboxylase
MLDWLADMLKLPEEFYSKGKGGGVIQGTASEACLVALLSSKSKAIEEWKTKNEKYTEKEYEDFLNSMVVYICDQSHSSVKKASMIAGIFY